MGSSLTNEIHIDPGGLYYHGSTVAAVAAVAVDRSSVASVSMPSALASMTQSAVRQGNPLACAVVDAVDVTQV